MGCDRRTVKKIVEEEADKKYTRKRGESSVDVYKGNILEWLEDGVNISRMLELAKEECEPSYQGGSSAFYARVKIFRDEWKKNRKDKFVRFEGLPGEYLQIDWGEVRNFPFTDIEGEKRYFFAARLKYSRFNYVEFQKNMVQETLIRCLLRTFEYIGGVPWVLVFDNMKTVSKGRDAKNRPVWNDTFIKFATEIDFHPDLCWPYSGNQKGAVENLVGWVKSNFLNGRKFIDDKDLKNQCVNWLEKKNNSKSQAHGKIPSELLEKENRKFTPLISSSKEYGIYKEVIPGPESLVMIDSNRYSVPVGYIGETLTSRIRQNVIDFYNGRTFVARHRRRLHQYKPIINPNHYEPLFKEKPRAKEVVYRDFLIDQDISVEAYITELCRRYRGAYGVHIVEMYEMWQQYGSDELGIACALASEHGAYGSDYLRSLLRSPDRRASIVSLELENVPAQREVDRELNSYDSYVIGGGQ